MSADPRPEQTTIRTDLGAIFVSLELSRATSAHHVLVAGPTEDVDASGAWRRHRQAVGVLGRAPGEGTGLEPGWR